MWALVCVYSYRQPKKTLSWHWKLKRRMQMLCCGLLAFIFITIFPKPVSEGIPAILTLSFTLPIDTALWTVFNLLTLLLSSIILCLNWLSQPSVLFIFRVKVSGSLTVSLLLQWSGITWNSSWIWTCRSSIWTCMPNSCRGIFCSFETVVFTSAEGLEILFILVT